MSLDILAVWVGGGVGSVVRYLLGQGLVSWLGPGLPWATLVINLLGSLILGVFLGLERSAPMTSPVRLLLTTGFCGGFTTFSTFSAETYTLGQQSPWLALGYGLVSVIGGVIGVALGQVWGQR